MTQSFIHEFDQSAQLRSKLSQILADFRACLQTAETEAVETSGQLELAHHIQSLGSVHKTLENGIFRILVLGDLKRGKSTLINAILGEKLLPSDVTPCTALLSVLKYGPTKQVTIHFKDETRSPQTVDFDTFKRDYTIDPSEAKSLDQAQELAFPDVSHAVIEYPLPLLEQGIELIDSPGLNDTESRNQLVLNFLENCHAVLFVLDATQPLTLDERRYLQNYLKGRGFALFFIINQWDRLEANFESTEGEPLAAIEQRVRAVFESNLKEYLAQDGSGAYEDRVFELSALKALRSRLKEPTLPAPEDFTCFMQTLTHFLNHDRAQVEWQYTMRSVRLAAQQVQEAVQRRIPLLDESVAELEQKLENIQSEFDQLAEIRDQYQSLIQTTGDREAQSIALSFQDYILNLERTFEEDFVQAQPDLDFLKFLKKESRAAFYTSFRRAFERYMNDRLAAWEFMAKQQISRAFEQLNEDADTYRVAYGQVVDAMNEKLLGDRFYAVGHRYDQEKTGVWVDSIQDLFEAIPDNLNSAVGGFNLFWQRVLQTALAYVCIVIALQILGLIFSSMALNVFAVILVGGGILTAQAEMVRQEFLKTTKREFAKHLPQIAQDQQGPIRQAVKKCFETYEVEVVDRINTDIASRRGELTNLIEKKQSHTLEKATEVERLQTMKRQVKDYVEAVEALADMPVMGQTARE